MYEKSRRGRSVASVRSSDLAGGAVERRAAAPLGALQRGPAPQARPALPGVHLVLVLVAAGFAVEVHVLLVREGRAAVLHRVLERLHQGAVEPAYLFGDSESLMRSQRSPAVNRISSE